MPHCVLSRAASSYSNENPARSCSWRLGLQQVGVTTFEVSDSQSHDPWIQNESCVAVVRHATGVQWRVAGSVNNRGDQEHAFMM